MRNQGEREIIVSDYTSGGTLCRWRDRPTIRDYIVRNYKRNRARERWEGHIDEERTSSMNFLTHFPSSIIVIGVVSHSDETAKQHRGQIKKCLGTIRKRKKRTVIKLFNQNVIV